MTVKEKIEIDILKETLSIIKFKKFMYGKFGENQEIGEHPSIRNYNKGMDDACEVIEDMIALIKERYEERKRGNNASDHKA